MKTYLKIFTALFLLTSTSANALDGGFYFSQSDKFNQTLTLFSSGEFFSYGGGLRVHGEIEDLENYALLGLKTRAKLFSSESNQSVSLDNQVFAGYSEDDNKTLEVLSGFSLNSGSSVYSIGTALTLYPKLYIGSYLQFGFKL